MTSSKSMICLAALALIAFLCHAAIGANSDDDRTATHAIAVDANGDKNASLSDFDGDGTVGFSDFLIFAGVFSAREGDEKYDTRYDLNGDGEIGFSDFVIFAQNFGKEVPTPVVAIPDANLRVAIEAALDKAIGASVTQAEMATLDSLEANDADISDLTGLEFAINLTRLWLSYNEIEDISALSGLTNLTELWLWDNKIEDISALSGLTKLTRLSLGSNNITDISALSGLTNLKILILKGNNISDLAPLAANKGLGRGVTVDVTDNHLNAASESTHIPTLQARGVSVSFVPASRLSIRDRAALIAFYDSMDGPNWKNNTNWLSEKPIGDWYGITTDDSGRVRRINLWCNGLKGQLPLQFGDLTALERLALASCEISDLSALSNLPRLTDLELRQNRISDVSPLLSLRNLRVLIVFENPLSYSSVHTHIPALQARGVDVTHHGYAVTGGDVSIEDGPLIYNDNLVVLPAARDATFQAPTSVFYQHFDDEFDFLVLVSTGFNDWPAGGYYSHVANDVQGIGMDIYSRSSEYGSAGRLQGLPFFSHPWWFRGIILHEVLHRWAVDGSHPWVSGGHFTTFSNIFGAFGGAFSAPFEQIVDLGENRFRAEKRPWSYTYGPLELYLAGLIPPEDVPDFWVAVDGKWIDQESGTFTATDIVKYTVYDIIDAYGRRVPPASSSQREFRAAVILVINEEDPTVDSKLLESLSADIAWFSFSGTDESEQNNFYEATGGRARIKMDGLSRFKRSAGAKIVVPRSFGTPPPPVVDGWETGNGEADR